jgi:sarcosine oxidase
MPGTVYDVIVVGCGSMGAAATFSLAKKGQKVLAIEQFESIPHDNGAHAGQSRIIRKAYFEHISYVPLLQKAYEGWDELEKLTGEHIMWKPGLLYIGPPGHEVIRGIKESSEKHDIPLIKAEETEFPFPDLFDIKNKDEAWLEPDAGFVLPEKTLSLLAKLAKNAGAEIITGEDVTGWRRQNGTIEVSTKSNHYQSKKILFTAGAWTGKLLADFRIPVTVSRQVLLWLKPATDQEAYRRMPCWMAAGSYEGVFYGFPLLDSKEFPGPAGLKFAWHHPGEITDPDHVNREVEKEEIENFSAN